MKVVFANLSSSQSEKEETKMGFLELLVILFMLVYLLLFVFVCLIDCDLRLKFYDKFGGKVGK